MAHTPSTRSTAPATSLVSSVVVDPVSHLLLGGAFAATIRPEVRPRGVAAALVLGSIFPDADLALAPRGFDLYLQAHAGGTHSLLWSAPEALVFAALLRPLVPASRVGVLAAAGWIGIVGHILSDFVDGSDIMLFSPISQVQYGLHLFGMGEPFVLLLVGAICLTTWRWPKRTLAVTWCAAASLICLLAIKGVTQRWATARYVTTVPEPQNLRELVPVRNTLFEWEVYDRIRDQVRVWRVDARSGRVTLVFEHANVEGPLVAASRKLPIVRGLLARTPIPLVRLGTEDDNQVVLWSDARMCSPRRCDVSFGGVFNSAGDLLSQIIRVGGFEQRRELPRE